MTYTISYQNPLTHFIDINLQLDQIHGDIIYLQLPAWRPGRYEVVNFAKNIQKFQVYDLDGGLLPFQKVAKDRWEVYTKGNKAIKIDYNYYAAQMDAGSSYLDEEQLYINFINCLLYMEGRMGESCHVKLKIPNHYIIACGLTETEKHTLTARDYYQLVDSPMIASAGLAHFTYQVGEIGFHIWMMGTFDLDVEKMEGDFQKFSASQINMMGDFPCRDYHFLFQILPYKHYHGVEHQNSTVITLGPSEKLNDKEFYQKLVGISSHELFHAWNIIRIRPVEMMPYDFTGENYFETGFVAEGFTTYYGDLFLVRCGFFSLEEYLGELNKLLKRHFENFGRFNLSIADSSFDLWLDGYSAGIPDRKVSIYIKGAIVAMILDLEIRRNTGGTASLDTLMQVLWNEYGKKDKGYALDDVIRESEKISGMSLEVYLQDYIRGVKPVEEKLSELFNHVGLVLLPEPNGKFHEQGFGFKIAEKEGRTYVSAIEPGADAEAVLAKDDEIISVNDRKIEDNFEGLINGNQAVELMIFRKNILKKVVLHKRNGNYFKQWKLSLKQEINAQQRENLEDWLGEYRL